MSKSNPIITRQDWLQQREAADREPGKFHGEIAKREIFWFLPDLNAWVKRVDGEKPWMGFDAATGQVRNDINLPEFYEPWALAFDDSNPPFYKWFQGGLTNACFNEVDAHVLAGHGNEIAFIFEGDQWDPDLNQGHGGPVVNKKITRSQLFWEVAKCAQLLKNLGLKKGDRIVLNMPNILEQIYFIEAAKRLGIIYTSVFGGFSAKTLLDRIIDFGPKVLITVNGAYRNGQLVSFKSQYIDKAIEEFSGEIQVLVLQHVNSPELKWDTKRDLWIHELMAEVEKQFQTAAEKLRIDLGPLPKNEAPVLSSDQMIKVVYSEVPPLPLEAEFPLFVVYTSGSTGKPKGVVHTQGGYLSGIAHTMRIAFDVNPEGDPEVIYVVADPGWITGQSYMISAPLITRTTSVITEGSPLFPSAGRLSSIIERYKVNIFKAGSTFLKTILSDPINIEDVKKYDRSSLRVGTFCAEPTSPEIQQFAMELLTPRYTNSYWGTEHGGIILTHFYGNEDFRLKPDAHTFPLPWIFADVWIPEKSVETNGQVAFEHRSAELEEKGEIVIIKPYPYLLRTLWGNAEHVGEKDWQGDADTFVKTYYSRWVGAWAYTQGDYASKYSDGSMMLHGRSDDVINTSGHRIGTEEIEHAILKDKALHPDTPVKNALVVGSPHSERGTVPIAFILTEGGQSLSPEIERRLKDLVKEEKGMLAIPAAFITLSQFPETRSGKYVRRILRNLLNDEPIGEMSTLRNPEAMKEIEAKLEAWRISSKKNPFVHPFMPEAIKKTKVQSIVDIELDLEKDIYLKDHQIYHSIIFPGAGYLDASLGVARQVFSNASILLEAFTIQKPWRLDPNQKQYGRILLKRSSSKLEHQEHYQVELFTYNSQSENWALNASATLQAEENEIPAPIAINEIKERLPNTISGGDYYLRVDRLGLNYGPAFQTLKKLWVGEHEAIAELELLPEFTLDGYCAHPALLDGCIQLFVLPFVKNGRNEASEMAYMPIGVEKVVWIKNFPRKISVYANWPQEERNAEGIIKHNFSVYDEEGRLLMWVKGFTAKCAPKEVLEKIIAEKIVEATPEHYHLSIPERGVLSNLRIEPKIISDPLPHEVQIKVYATGLNFRDVLNVMGLYPGDPGPLGLECSGIITAVGRDVRDFSVNDEVMALSWDSFSDRVNVDARNVTKKPAYLGFDEAAGIPLVFQTVYYSLVTLAHLKKGDRILIHAAAGGIGTSAIQIAQYLGAEIYATASSAKWDFLKAQGINHIYNSRTLDFAEGILKDTKGAGVDVVINALSSEFIDKTVSCMAKNGRFIEIGKREIWSVEKMNAIRPDIDYHIFAIDDFMHNSPEKIHDTWKGLQLFFETKKSSFLPITDFLISNCVEAFRFMQAAKHIGKVILIAKLKAEDKSLFSEQASQLEFGRPIGGPGESSDDGFQKGGRDLLKDRLLQMPENERETGLQLYLSEQVCEALNLGSPESLDLNRGFFDLNMDSLMAMELKNRLQQDVGEEKILIPTLVFNYPSVNALKKFYKEALFPELFGSESGASPKDARSAKELAEEAAIEQEAKDLSIDEMLKEIEKEEDDE